MDLNIRTVRPADATQCARLIVEAFNGIADRHGFPRDFPSIELATQRAASRIDDPSVYGVVAEKTGTVVGVNFLAEGDPIRAVGPIAVDPSVQGGGVGRLLMQAVLERARGSVSVRLVQDAFNTRSVALYASLGFEVKEPLLLMCGTPRSKPPLGLTVRSLTSEDISACENLCASVHGYERSNELGNAIRVFTPFVVEREGRITGYMSAATFWIMNHGVAETEADMRALISGAGSTSAEPISFLLPTRQASLFRWCLEEGLQVAKPMTLMNMGEYQQPRGYYFPSVLY